MPRVWAVGKRRMGFSSTTVPMSWPSSAVSEAFGESAGVKCMLGCMMETRLGLTAAAHLASARPNIHYVDLDGYLLVTEDPIIGGAAWDDGTITLPDDPGIGAEVDPSFLEGCHCVTVD